MGDHTEIDMLPLPLRSKDHGQLLDLVDRLRSQGISRYVGLPQLIVCGSQSSGKSSVLEAVSGVRFPTKDNLCTRFATELILRRDPTTNVTVAIIPGAERPEDEKAKLLGFKIPIVQINDFPLLIDAAKEAMGLDSSVKAFSDDVLRIEISGAEQPNLTLVDLPGLIHADNKQQPAMDVQLVFSLVKSYIENPRSIIITVVSTKESNANQIMLKLARDVDPNGMRTLGIITKPDTFQVGSESEKHFLDLAGSEEAIFPLGWHVLKNRDHDRRECSVDERDESEREFFSHGVWASLPAKLLGIGALRPRLSILLKDRVVSELPRLIRDVEASIQASQNRLNRLGQARGTIQQQKIYLVRVSRLFSSLVKAAVDGVYLHDFFTEAMIPADSRKRLRTVVQNILLEFAEVMRVKDHTREVSSTRPEADIPAVVDQMCESMRQTRGWELPEIFNPLFIGDLFYYRSKPWKKLVERYSEKILDATRSTLRLILFYTADEITSERLIREVIDPAMKRYAAQLERKVAEIMRPHQEGHRITYDHCFTKTIERARKKHAEKYQVRRIKDFFGVDPDGGSPYVHDPQPFSTKKLVATLDQPTEADTDDMNHYAYSEAVDCMEAYYKVSTVFNHHPPTQSPSPNKAVVPKIGIKEALQKPT